MSTVKINGVWHAGPSSGADSGLEPRVAAIEEKISIQASAQNPVMDKDFINSSIQTATATFRGINDCWCALGALGSAPDNNDYAVLKRCNDYIYKFDDDPDEPHNIGDIFGYGGIVYRVVTDFQGSFDETKCEKIGEFALYGGEEPDDVMGVQRYYSYSIEGKTYFRIADWDTENPDGLSPSDPSWIPANWVLIEGTHWSVDTPLATWRWKYTRPSGSGVYAWEAEYKINDAPLTAAQLAALNSNITEALTNKLVALPAKPVDTAAQVLTEAEKAQARTNIGAGTSNFSGSYNDLSNKPTIPSEPSDMTGATLQDAGTHGLVPAPAAGDEGKFLRGDGTWQNVSVPQEIMNLIYAGL